MGIVSSDSLAVTLDGLNEAFFIGGTLSRRDRERAAEWIADRQGRPGSYANMFAPTSRDFREGIRLFTGEQVKGGGGMAHILGEEACRALILLDVQGENVRRSLEAASAGMMRRLKNSRTPMDGTYCCSRCSVALWRHLAAGGLGELKEPLLAAGMKTLNSRRLGDGRWKGFPFYYTLLALTEIGSQAALEQMRYASPLCEVYLGLRSRGERFTERRRLLATRVLEQASRG